MPHCDHWTCTEVVERICVTPGRLMLWEEDKAWPSLAEGEALAELFERPLAYFAVTYNEPN